MSHLIEAYARQCNVKIDKPFILSKFFPLPFDEDYITFSSQGAMSGKNYLYFQDVINLILPVLEKNNMKIIQMGDGKEEKYNNVFDLLGVTTVQQSASLLESSRCRLHFGVDSFLIHLANGLGKKVVGIYSVSPPSVCGPFFGNPEDSITLEPSLNGEKYSYNPNQDPKIVSRIKPEEVAEAVLKLLNLKLEQKVKSIYFGDKYRNIYFDIIPNQALDANSYVGAIPHVRYDYVGQSEKAERNLYAQVALRQTVIVTDKILQIDVLKRLKPNLQQLVILIQDESMKKFVHEVHRAGINYYLLTYLNEEDLEKIKLTYSDYNLINVEKDFEEKINLESASEDLFVKSTKFILSEGKTYISKYHWENDLPATSALENETKIKKEDLIKLNKNLNYCYIYEKT